MQVTVCGKIRNTSLYPVLDATSHLMDKVERLYFKERYIKHADRNGLKRLFLKAYGITGRQRNGVSVKIGAMHLESADDGIHGDCIREGGCQPLGIEIPSMLSVRKGMRML